MHTIRLAGRCLVAIGAATVGLAACGGSSGGSGGDSPPADPKAAAQQAFATLADRDGTTATIKLDMTAADLSALSATGGGAPIGAAEAAAITGGTVTVALKASGSSFADDAAQGDLGQESVAVDVDAGGGHPKVVQLVLADKAVYVRGDVGALAQIAGTDATELQDLGARVPAQYAFVRDAIAGRWLKVDVAQLGGLLKEGSPSGVPSVAPSQASGLATGFGRLFARDITVTRAAPDATRGDHYVLTGNQRTLATDGIGLLRSQLSSVPGATVLLKAFSPSTVDSKTFTIDEYVQDGAVSAVRVALKPLLSARAAAAVKGDPTLEVALADHATVAAPTSATTVDLSSVAGLIGGLS